MTDDTAAAPALDFDPVPALASGLSLPASGVAAVLALLDEGNTVPFIARYRKERTGGLDEVQIRAIEERRSYLVELEERRAAVLASIKEQGKLTPELEQQLLAATVKSELEDLYAPYRSRASGGCSRSPTRSSRRARPVIRSPKLRRSSASTSRLPRMRWRVRATSSPSNSPIPPRFVRSCAARWRSTASSWPR